MGHSIEARREEPMAMKSLVFIFAAVCLLASQHVLGEELNIKADEEDETKNVMDLPPMEAEVRNRFWLKGMDKLVPKACTECPDGFDAVEPCTMYSDTTCEEQCEIEEINPGNRQGRRHSSRDGAYDNDCHASSLDGFGWCSANNQRATKFQVKYSQDGSSWLDVNGGQQFQGNDNDENRRLSTFPAVKARYWRLYINDFVGHMSLRWGLQGRRPTCKQDDKCVPIELNPHNRAGRTYRSIHGNANPDAACGASALDSYGWCSANNQNNNEWLQIDLGKPKRISGVMTQRRQHNAQRVNRYKMQYSTDGTNFQWIMGGHTFVGNDANHEERKENTF